MAPRVWMSNPALLPIDCMAPSMVLLTWALPLMVAAARLAVLLPDSCSMALRRSAMPPSSCAEAARGWRKIPGASPSAEARETLQRFCYLNEFIIKSQ